MKKYEGNMKKYVGHVKIRTLPIYRPWDLEKFRAHPFILGRSGVGGGSQFPGLGVPQRKDMKHVNSDLSSCIIWALGLGKNTSYLICGHEACFY